MQTRLQGNLLSQLSQDNTRAAAFDWRFYWYMVKRRHWLLVIPTILLSLAAYYIKLTTDPVYESSTKILVSGSKLMTPSVRRLVPGVTATDEISGVKNYVQSATCIVGLINTLNLKMPPAITARAAELSRTLPEMSQQEIENMLFIDKVRDEITVESQGRDIIKISAAHGNPQKAYMLTKTLAQVFMDEFQRRQVGSIRGVREFSEEQVAIYRQKLQESEERLRLFQEGIIRNRMEDTDIGRATSDRIKTDIANLNSSVRDKEARLQLLAENLQSTMNKPQKIRTAEIQKSRAQLFGKVDELIDFLSRFTWADSPILRLNDDINAIRDDIRDNLKAHIKSVYGEKDEASGNLLVEWNLALLDIEVFQREKNGLQIKADALEKSLMQGPTYEMTLRNLQQDVEQNRDMYLQFLQQTRGTQIEEQIQRRDAEFKLQIVAVAQKPLYPINAGMKFTLILIFLPFLGLAIGGGIVFGLDYIDHSVRDVQEVEKEFNVPVWGVIPEIEGGTAGFWSRFGWIVISLLITGVGATMIYLVEKGGARTLF